MLMSMVIDYASACAAFPRWEQLSMRRSVKWRTYPAEVVPLPIAEMDFPLPQPIKTALHEAIDISDAGYASPWILHRKALALASFSARTWQWEVNPHQCIHCNSVYDGITATLRALLPPGSRVAISPPVYTPFYDYPHDAGLEVVEVPLRRSTDNEFRLDIAALQQAFENNIGAYILCNPQNPTGTIHSREELSQLADLAEEYGVWIISDEIHAPLIYDQSTYTPFHMVNENARQRSVSFHSATKGWNFPGLTAATGIVADEKLYTEITPRLPRELPCKSSLFGCIASEIAYVQCEDWLSDTISVLDFNRHYLHEALIRSGLQVKYRIPEATYLAWLDHSSLGWPEDPAPSIESKAQVALTSGIKFGAAGKDFVRLNFACSPIIIDKAIEQIAQVQYDIH